jgi:cellulose 1,4-beta-cellobiosidase
VSVNLAPDTTPPTVPTNLSGTAVSQSQINLSWTASTDPVVPGHVTSGVAGYKVFRNGTQVGTPSTTSYSDTGLTAATTYQYTVSAYDTAGNVSAQSAAVGVTTQNATAFGIGGEVMTTAALSVRNKPNTKSGKLLCTRPSGALGTITAGPTSANGYTWWSVNYNTGCSGWSVQNYLTTSIAMGNTVNQFAGASESLPAAGATTGGNSSQVAGAAQAIEGLQTELRGVLQDLGLQVLLTEVGGSR